MCDFCVARVGFALRCLLWLPRAMIIYLRFFDVMTASANSLGRFAALALLLGMSGCGEPGNSPEREAPTAQAERRDIIEEIRLSGDIAPAFQVEIKPEVGGKLREVHATTGQEAKEGELALRHRRQRPANRAGCRGSGDRRRPGLGGKTRRQPRTRPRTLRSQTHQQGSLRKPRRRPPPGGERTAARAEPPRNRRRPHHQNPRPRPGRRHHSFGPGHRRSGRHPRRSVNAGTTLATFADLSTLIVDAHVNQLDIGKVEIGDAVEVLGGADDSIRATAKINFIAPLATTKNNVKGFTVQAVLGGDTSAFRPGMTVAIRLPLANATNAVSVPARRGLRNPPRSESSTSPAPTAPPNHVRSKSARPTSSTPKSAPACRKARACC